MLHVYDATSNQTVNPGLAAGAVFELQGPRIAFYVDETAHGRRDLNRDGDARDLVVYTREGASGRLVNVRLASARFGFDFDGLVDLESGRAAFLVDERAQAEGT